MLRKSKPPTTARLPRLPVFPQYTHDYFPKKAQRWLLIVMGFVAFFYGFLFALGGTFVIMPLIAPIAIAALLIVWLLPDMERAPTVLLTRLFFAFVVAVTCWPDYLALALPGMPWITAIRLVTTPLALVMLIALSISRDFREELAAILAPSSIITKLLLAFVLICFLSIAISAKPMISFNKFIVAQISWTLIFFVSCYVFSRPGQTNKFSYILWACALFTCAIGLWEWQIQRLPWAGHIPSFLKVEEELLAGLLNASGRSATGLYRVKSIFTTPLGLGEFLALATPIILHIVLTSKNIVIKALGIASLLVILMVLLRTDSRLGMVGYFMSFLLTILTWAALNWRANRNNIVAQGVLLFYPVIFVAFITATFFVRRLEVLVWGSGAQQASTDARGIQVEMGLPKIFSQPWGHGIGQGAEALGFRSPTGILTIDTYYLAAALEFGVIGFCVFFGMFAAAMYMGGKAVLDVKDKEVALLAPLCIAIANFFVIKSVFSQLSNHPLVFAMLGAIVGLVYRAKTDPSVLRTPT